MEKPSRQSIRILKRATSQPKFVDELLTEPDRVLGSYDLATEDLEYLKSLRSVEEIESAYQAIQVAEAPFPRLPGPPNLYTLVAVLFILVFLIWTYMLGNLLFDESNPWLKSIFGIPYWYELPRAWNWVLVLCAVAAAIFFLLSFIRMLFVVKPTTRITLLLVMVMLMFLPLFLLSQTALYTLSRILLVAVFTLLPASLYPLFITTKSEILWEEFAHNLACLDPVRYQSLVKIYFKKFESIYGSVRYRASEGIALRGEASFSVLLATFIIGLGWILLFTAPIETIPLASLNSTSAVGTGEATAENASSATEDSGDVTDEAGPSPPQGEGDISADTGSQAVEEPGTVTESDGLVSEFFAVFVHPFTFGFLGAYLFSLQLLFRRYVQSDLKSTAYTHVSQRILSTWVWALVLTVLWQGVGDDWHVGIQIVSVLAFVVGIFPDIAWQVISKPLKRLLGLIIPSLRQGCPLSQIEGITIWSEARLLEEDIENVQNLVTVRVFDLMLRTNLGPQRIVNWIDQGVLQLRLGRESRSGDKSPLLEALTKRGIMTATDLLASYEAFKQSHAVESFLSQELDPMLESLLPAIDDDPNLYHVKAWHEMRSKLNEELPDAIEAQISGRGIVLSAKELSEQVSTSLEAS